MPNQETLKEYLVNIGWSEDTLGLGKVKNSIGTTENLLNKLGNNFAKNMGKASLSLMGVILDVNTAMADLLIGTANADMATERFARKMWTTEENARSLTRALDVLGESYGDIAYMTPEEYEHLLELRNLGLQLEPPAELQETYRLVRDLIQEFNKFTTIASYAKDWIAYYLGQYLGEDFTKLLNMMKNFNQWLIEKMPSATNEIAKFFVYFFKMAKAGAIAIRDLIDMIGRLWKSLDTGQKAALAGITGFVALLKAGPIGWLMGALVAILLLLDDFQTWERGGKSFFNWANFKELFQTEEAQKMAEAFNDMLTSISSMGTALWDAISALTGWETPLDAIEDAFKAIADLVTMIVTGVAYVADLLGMLSAGSIAKQKQFNEKYGGSKYNTFWDYIAKYGGAEGGYKYMQDVFKGTLEDFSAEGASESGTLSGDQWTMIADYWNKQQRGFTPTEINQIRGFLGWDQTPVDVNVDIDINSTTGTSTTTTTINGEVKNRQQFSIFT